MKESTLNPEEAFYDYTIPAGDGWMHTINAGQTLRIEDVEGNQAVDTLFYNADAPEDRYSVVNTLQKQRNLYITTGSQLISSEGNVLMTVVADNCGRHDTVGGACSRESNIVRYDDKKEYMHACRDIFLNQICEWGDNEMDKRDIGHNINFFMNVPVTPEGGLTFEDGISSAGRYVELKAQIDTIVLISNCPQLNNPCNAYNPTPARVLIWD